MPAALEGGEWSAARPGRTLHPEKTRYPIYKRLDGSQGRSGRAENLVPTGIRSRTVQPVVSHYTDWATWPTSDTYYSRIIYTLDINVLHLMRFLYSRVSFYDDSLLRPMSSRTEHPRLAVPHCHNSSVLSALSALLVLLRCACVSYFSILVQYFWVECDFSTHDVYQKERREYNIKTVDVTFCLDVFWSTACALRQQNKKWFDWYFINYLCNFLYA
jgi:hypothetical protein